MESARHAEDAEVPAVRFAEVQDPGGEQQVQRRDHGREAGRSTGWALVGTEGAGTGALVVIAYG